MLVWCVNSTAVIRLDAVLGSRGFSCGVHERGLQRPNEDELVWEYENIDLKIAFRHAQSGWVVKTWSID